MVEANLNVDLEQLFSVAEVQVVQSIDAKGLQETLRWIVAKLQSPGFSPAAGRLGKVEEELANLVNANTSLRDKVKALEEQQGGLTEQLDTKLDKDQLPDSKLPEDLLGVSSDVAKLEERIAALEARSNPAAGPANSEDDRQGDAAEPSSGSDAPSEATASPAAAAPPADDSSLARRLAAAERAIEDLRASLQGTTPPQASSDGSGPQAAGPASDLDSLTQAMQGKATKEELAVVHARLDGKVDRAEMDAVLQAGGPVIGGSEGDGASPAVEIGEDGQVDSSVLADAINRVATELQSMRTLVVVLQERVKGKADQDSLLEDRAQVATLRGTMEKLQWQVDSLGAAANGSGATKDAQDAGSMEASDGAWLPQAGQQQQSGELTLRIERLEAALLGRSAAGRHSGLSPAAAAAANGSGFESTMRSSLREAAAAIPRPEGVDGKLDDIYARLDHKASQADLEGLMARLRDLAARLDGSALLAANEPPSPPGFEEPLFADRPESPLPHWSPEQADGSRWEGLEAALAALRDEVAAKADLDTVMGLDGRVTDVAMGLAEKADQSALDELRLKLALVGAAGEGGPDGGGTDGLVSLLQGMVADKAGKSELDVLKGLLATKAGRDELQALAARLQALAAAAPAAVLGARKDGQLDDMLASRASKDELATLADQVGDLYAELQKLRRELSASNLKEATFSSMVLSDQDAEGDASSMPHDSALGQGMPQGEQPVIKMVHALANELQALKDQLETVAHAANIIAVGLEPRTSLPADQATSTMNGYNGQAGHNPSMESSSLAPSGRESRETKGAYDRLVKLLGSQGIHHKMDFFDPDVLNRMAQKMAAVDAMLKSPGFSRGAGPDVGLKDLEAQIRRLGRDMRAVKERMADTTNVSVQALNRMADGDHAMLSGRPLMGYRCLACDRPLEKLDERPGPHVPTHQMTVKAAPADSARPGKPGLTPESSHVVSSGKPVKKLPYDPSQRGPQNWYEDARGAPAEALPKADVGPRLSPGGWRGTSQAGGTRTPTLPDIRSPPQIASPGMRVSEPELP